MKKAQIAICAFYFLVFTETRKQIIFYLYSFVFHWSTLLKTD